MKKNALKIAVVGATGMVGNTMLSILSERGFDIKNVTAIASAKSVHKEITYGDMGTLKVHDINKVNFSDFHVALFSPGSKVSAEYAPIAAKSGCVVIDNTSYFRNHPEIPLVVPEINPEEIAKYKNHNIISNPNCSTIQMLMAVAPLHKKYTIKRLVVSTYQSVSGAGKSAMDELHQQTKSIIVNQPLEKQAFVKPIAFNIIPQIDVFMDDGSTKEEWKMITETKKILDPKIKVAATCARVPVFIGHAVSANIEFEEEIDSIKAIKSFLHAKDGIIVYDDPDDMKFITPIDCTGEDHVFISRIREDYSVENGINMWIVADNMRKGAALNTVQIMEMLAKDYL